MHSSLVWRLLFKYYARYGFDATFAISDWKQTVVAMAKVFCLRLPESIRISAYDLAGREGVSINLFIAMAVAGKIVRLKQGDLRDTDEPRVDGAQP